MVRAELGIYQYDVVLLCMGPPAGPEIMHTTRLAATHVGPIFLGFVLSANVCSWSASIPLIWLPKTMPFDQQLWLRLRRCAKANQKLV